MEDELRYDWTIPLGSAETLELTWTSEDGSPIDLTGWTAEVWGEAAPIAGQVTAAFGARTAGRIDLRIAALRTLRAGIAHEFRLSLQPPAGARQIALWRFVVVPR